MCLGVGPCKGSARYNLCLCAYRYRTVATVDVHREVVAKLCAQIVVGRCVERQGCRKCALRVGYSLEVCYLVWRECRLQVGERNVVEVGHDVVVLACRHNVETEAILVGILCHYCVGAILHTIVGVRLKFANRCC